MKKKIIKKLFQKSKKEPHFKEQSNQHDIELKNQDITGDYEKNLAIFKSLYSIPINTDVKLREFTIVSGNRRAFIIFLSTMAELTHIEVGIIK